MRVRTFISLPTSLLLTVTLGAFTAAYAQGNSNEHSRAKQTMVYDGNPGGVRYLEEGQPAVIIHPTVEAMDKAQRAARPHRTSNLYYHGGVSDGTAGVIGVETAPKVYIVFWGSQWTANDPYNEATNEINFLSGVGGSSWFNSVTQYCQGVASGTITCGTSGQHAGNPAGIYAGYWYDNASAAPSQPTQSQLASEAVRAAAHFGNTSVGSNASVQYVIATATGNNASGFGTQYCAWHSSTSSSYGYIAYTNLPYMTDAGSSCGANFNGLGYTAGQTIVEGHELAETATDQFPNGGWLDSGGSENGDKCAWTSGTTFVSFSTGTFAVQPLWSNASSSCVISY